MCLLGIVIKWAGLGGILVWSQLLNVVRTYFEENGP